MKHELFGLISVVFLLYGCNSTPMKQNSSYQSQLQIEKGEVNSVIQNLDSSIVESSKYLISRITANSKIAVVNIQSPTINLTNYIIDILLMYLVNEDKFIVIERSELDIIEKEHNYQLSGIVNDETVVSIGKQLGTQYIVIGSMLPLGEMYSLRIKILNVETAQIIGTKIFQVNIDNTLLALLNVSNDDQVRKDKIEEKNIDRNNIINGDINIINNNTTTINGDVYINNPNW